MKIDHSQVHPRSLRIWQFLLYLMQWVKLLAYTFFICFTLTLEMTNKAKECLCGLYEKQLI